MIWLLRHGDAEDGAGKPDAERELTEKGESQAVNAGRALKKLGVKLDVCLDQPEGPGQADRRARLRRSSGVPIEQDTASRVATSTPWRLPPAAAR